MCIFFYYSNNFNFSSDFFILIPTRRCQYYCIPSLHYYHILLYGFMVSYGRSGQKLRIHGAPQRTESFVITREEEPAAFPDMFRQRWLLFFFDRQSKTAAVSAAAVFILKSRESSRSAASSEQIALASIASISQDCKRNLRDYPDAADTTPAFSRRNREHTGSLPCSSPPRTSLSGTGGSLLAGTKKNSGRVCGRCFLCWHRAIFPVRRQTSIFATDELNFRVRNGNGWTLAVISTDY